MRMSSAYRILDSAGKVWYGGGGTLWRCDLSLPLHFGGGGEIIYPCRPWLSVTIRGYPFTYTYVTDATSSPPSLNRITRTPCVARPAMRISA